MVDRALQTLARFLIDLKIQWERGQTLTGPRFRRKLCELFSSGGNPRLYKPACVCYILHIDSVS
jgi:hypothetical protein